MSSSSAKDPSSQHKDLIPQGFPRNLDWYPDHRLSSLERLYDFVNSECEKAVGWYYRSKRSKSRLGYWLRAGAIVAVATAGIIPIIGEIFEASDGSPLISPAWATVALAIAALFVALDRFGGYTSGWVRYVRTAQKLSILQADFCLDWEEYRFNLPHTHEEEHVEYIKEGIRKCREFLREVNREVQNETNLWAQEFQQALVEVDTLSNHKPGETK
jgi:hypothetical protein